MSLTLQPEPDWMIYGDDPDIETDYEDDEFDDYDKEDCD